MDERVNFNPESDREDYFTEEQSQDSSIELDESFTCSEDEQLALDEIHRHLFKATNIDFSHYRKTTVFRRLSRRMAMSKSATYSEYLDYINNNAGELENLYDDLLLSYTEFFREPYVFNILKEKVFPVLIEQRSTKDTLRFWVPGCSTGEEVYSLAICFQEFLQEQNSNVNLKAQFFGTDLNPRHITTARAALYSEKVRKNISLQRIEQFFDQTDDGLKVTKHIREMCVFAVQNITQDPPFSNIDLVSCRNVLIYFDSSFQDIAIPMFHFSLRSDGFLLLGSSESMGRFNDLFSSVDPKINLFSKRHSRLKSVYRFPVTRLPGKYAFDTEGIQTENKSQSSKPDINRQIDTIILDTYTPPCVLVDSNLILRQFRGQVFPFIQPSAGDASLKLSKMVGENLMPELYVAIEEAKKKNASIKKKGIAFNHLDVTYTINIIVTPVHDSSRKEQCFLILFEKTPETTGLLLEKIEPDVLNGELQKLRDELLTTKEHLQSIIEEKDEVNQELWASNEEVQSTNEELQSVNEEMEAAKEELESSNEELLALNEELRLKNNELNAAKYFSDNIIETARAIFITTDNTLHISTVNHFAEEITGYSRNEIIGKSCLSLFFPDHTQDSLPDDFQKLLTSQTDACKIEENFFSRDGDERLISWRCCTLKDINNCISGILLIGIDITRQRIAEKSLIESENRYRALVESSQDLIWECDAQGHYTFLNKAAEDLFGYSKQEMTGKKIFDFDTPDSPETLVTMFKMLASGKTVAGFESIQHGKSNQTIHLIINAVPEFSKDGTLIKIRGTAHNVTNWKAAELKYQTLFSEMLDGFALHEIIYDQSAKPIDYKLITANPAFEKQTGQKLQNFTGKTGSKLLPQSQHLIDIYGKVALSGVPAFFEDYSIDLKRHYAVRAFRSAPGQVACIFSDITEQKISEFRLKDLLQRFDQLAVQTKTFLWEIDTDGLITFVSPSIEKIAGYTPDEIIGKLYFWDILPDYERDTFRDSISKIIKEHKCIDNFQTTILTKDNRQIWVSTDAFPHFNTDGTLTGYRGGHTDITEFKTNELTKKKLEEQQLQSQRLESLGVLAGGVAHDFNNLLGGIFGFIDLSIDECKNTKAAQYLTTALATIERARSLTQRLLTFAKGGSPIQTVGELFPFIEETIKFALSGSNVSCRYEIDPELYLCNFDKNQIGQVFDNIIINALQAMPAGGIINITAKNITLSGNFHLSLEPGDYIKITVTDTGIGIPPEVISRIFDPFFTTKMKGHGLGLATCYSIITRHRGFIDVESTPGKGTSFHIYLPANKENMQNNLKEKPTQHRGHGIFLVMDDEEVIRMTMETMLSLFGYKVICKDNGEDALKFFNEAKLNTTRISGVILDLTIPGGMGGKDVIAEIRKIDADVPVFVSSGYADDPVMANPAKYGFTGSICKPFRVADLTNLLSSHIAQP
ncbi:MAG: PAS domain S-box protein [Chitinispirillaceae bacterium]|nr:PAS domain S-box protein [Chitinispirillaceae bacterium]